MCHDVKSSRSPSCLDCSSAKESAHYIQKIHPAGTAARQPAMLPAMAAERTRADTVRAPEHGQAVTTVACPLDVDALIPANQILDRLGF